MPKEMDLSGSWEILPVSRFDGNYDLPGSWKKIQVPGHWQTVAGLEDYAGKVVYKKAFKFKPEPDQRFFLRLHGVFYWATAYLNDARLGSNEGYFFPVDHEVTGLLMKDNLLLLEVDCPDEPDKANKRQLTGVFHHWDCIDPKTNPGGIWLPVEILRSGPVRLSNPLFTNVYLGPEHKTARIMGQVTLDAARAQNLNVRISFIPKTFQGETQVFEREVSKPAGSHTYHYQLDLKDPTLWWTHDHGRPDLYTLRVEVFGKDSDQPSDLFETRFGVRTFEMRNYIAYLNGRRLYLRGNNYPPGDTRLASMSRERVKEDVRLARECNLNFLRVHAHVDHPLFYEACDEQGVLLWQDFPMQWHYRDEVEPQAARQVRRMIFHLGSHPSIGAWCMHNEPIRQFDVHKRFGPIAVARWLSSIFIWNKNRDRMDKNLAAKARFLDPHRFVTECSGERGLFRTPGDLHYYFGWYFGPLHWLHRRWRKRPDKFRFITEFGAQSFPNLESSRKFMPDRIEDVDFRLLKARHHYQPEVMRWFVNPKRFSTLAEFIQATQDYQSKVNRYYIDRMRALKYKPNGGCVAFVLLDSNPAVQWSVIDYWRVPKSSYYELRQAMSPVYAFTLLDKPRYRLNEIVKLPVYAVNDAWAEAAVKVKIQAITPTGETVLEETREQVLAADSEAVALMNPELRLRWQGTYQVLIFLESQEGRLENEYQVKVK